MMKKLVALCLTPLMLAACVGTPVLQQPTHLFADRLFPPPSERINAADVFAASDKMRSYLKNDIAALLRAFGLDDLQRKKCMADILCDECPLAPWHGWVRPGWGPGRRPARYSPSGPRPPKSLSARMR